MANSYFQYIPRRNRAKGLVPRIRRCSKRFKDALVAGDKQRQESAASDAWDLLTKLFEILRGEQDDGHLAPALMKVDTALIATGISSDEQKRMLALKRIDRSRSTSLSLRDTLNKIAHYKEATFRVDRRGAHYILLGGIFKKEHWIAEILVSKLCKNAAAAIQGITG